MKMNPSKTNRYISEPYTTKSSVINASVYGVLFVAWLALQLHK